MKGSVAIILSLLLALALVGCAAQTPESNREVVFLSQREKQKWIEPLVERLSTMKPMAGERSLPGETDDRIDYGLAVGLFDMDLDGTPELMMYVGGGSSGISNVNVYDLYTGEYLGMVDGGWSVYWDTERGTPEVLSRCSLRWGTAGWSFYVDRAVMTQADGQRTVTSEEWLSVHYTLEQIRLPSEDGELLFEDVCTGATFRVDGEEVHLDQFPTAYYAFADGRLRLPETDLTFHWWSHVCDGEEDAEARARKMAEALVSSEQQFVKR